MRVLPPLAMLLWPGMLAAQSFRVEVVPDTATVGDVVQVVVRAAVAREVRVVFPDSLLVSGGLENAARPRLLVDTLEGGLEVTAVYAVTPWRPGETPLPELDVQLFVPGAGVRRERVALPRIDVTSVLPPDTAGVEPKPPRGVLGASWLLWPFLLALLVVLAALAGAYAWYRRRRPAAPVIPLVPLRPPRERALEALDRAMRLGLLEAQEFKAFYSLVGEAVRHYVAELDDRWGEDLTTTELVVQMRVLAPEEDVRVLGVLLEAADMVKFARHVPAPPEAEEVWARARGWVERYPPPVAEPGEAAA